MADAEISVEVVYALAERQAVAALRVPVGTTARQAALRSGLQDGFEGLDLANAPLGIFGRLLSDAEGRVLEDGERVEVLRPLLVDPKEVRRQRAERLARERAADKPGR